MTTPSMTREHVIAILKNASISPSEQRIAIYTYLLMTEAHPTVDMVFKSLAPLHPTLSRTTVYNTLKLLTTKNLANPLNIDDCELRYEAEKPPHAHFKCTRCQKVCDIYDIPLPTLTPTDREHFKVHATQLNFYGICQDCQRQQQTDQD